MEDFIAAPFPVKKDGRHLIRVQRPATSHLSFQSISHHPCSFPHHGRSQRTRFLYLQVKEFERSSIGEPNRPGASILDTWAQGLRISGCRRYSLRTPAVGSKSTRHWGPKKKFG